jgi:hypothetical protein
MRFFGVKFKFNFVSSINKKYYIVPLAFKKGFRCTRRKIGICHATRFLATKQAGG